MTTQPSTVTAPATDLPAVLKTGLSPNGAGSPNGSPSHAPSSRPARPRRASRWRAYLFGGLVVALAAVIFRTVQLFFLSDVQTGLVWLTKILTDPFHDVKLYHRAPLQVLRGELDEPAVVEPTA